MYARSFWKPVAFSLNFSKFNRISQFKNGAFRNFSIKIHSKNLLSVSTRIQWAQVLRNNARFNHKAAVLDRIGGPLEIKEVPSRELKNDEVRIAVHACSVNASDRLICMGQYETIPHPPFIPGYELSGEIKEIGKDVKLLSVGDRVIGLAKEVLGGFSEECILQAQDVWQLPRSMPLATAASIADSYATVLISARRAAIHPDDDVLVTAAAGGLGLAAIDVAANIFKGRVIGACGTEDRTQLVRDKGGFAAFNYEKQNLIEEVMKITEGRGAKVIFDAVGGEVFENCLQCIAHEGSIIVAGFASRRIPHILTSQLLPKSCAIIGISLTHYRREANNVYRGTVQEVIDMVQEEFVEPHISAEFKLEQANEALKFLEDKKASGKIILNIR